MRDAMIHRGPDDQGIYIAPDRSVGLGHRRLSIIDLSPAGRQPMSDREGRFWITFNGEVYNFADLRGDLERDGIVFQSKSDTEVLLYLYKKHGKEMVHLLEGMFAFAIYDQQKREFFLVRDRIGIKPLYYFNRGGTFGFASEIKALLASGKVARDVSPVAFNHYLSFLTTPAPQTLFEGILKLPAAHRMLVTAKGEIEIDQWWNPLTTPPSRLSEQDHIDNIRQLLKESIRYRMISDVPFGVFLSGGIDSSTNVALMAELMDRPVDTFSVAFKNEANYNELPFARTVAKAFKTNHHEIEIDMRDFLDFLPRLVHHEDEPIADPACVPLYYVSKLAKDRGVTVCQVGEGSDELFCGYPHWLSMLRLERQRRTLSVIPQSLQRVAWFFAKQLSSSSSRRLEYIRRASNNEPLFWGGAEAFYESEKRSLLNRSWAARLNGTSSASVVSGYFNEFLQSSGNLDPLNWMTFVDLKLRLPELLLMRVDKMTMATSVEARVPFLHHKFVEYVMSIPESSRVQGLSTKYLLKKAVSGIIPDETINRPKQGFGVPIAEWYQHGLGDQMRQKVNAFTKSHPYLDSAEVSRLLSQSGRSLPWHLWYLFNFALWHETWIEQKQPQEIWTDLKN